MAEWINMDASRSLPLLRARGEGQDLEYMVSFPSNARDLAKEIAAFASTNSGTILIGVADDGELIGIPHLDDAQVRDSLLQRVEGLCNGPIQPSITPGAVFAKESDRTVLVLHVTRGNQPVYYCQHTPYVRHLTESRPARPDEVVERVESWLKTRPSETNSRSEFYGQLISAIRELLLWPDELDNRRVNPWLDSLKWMLKAHGDDIRQLSANQVAVELGIRERLEELADAADAAGSHELFMGQASWNEFSEMVHRVETSAAQFKRDFIDILKVGERTRSIAVEELQELSRKMEIANRRADGLVEQGRIQELQSEVAQIGRNLKRLSLWGLDREEDSLVERLCQLGKRLHVVDTLRFTMGGREVAELLEATSWGAAEVQNLTLQIS